jgi:hypothetical protein
MLEIQRKLEPSYLKKNSQWRKLFYVAVPLEAKRIGGEKAGI